MTTPIGTLIKELQKFPLHAEASAVNGGLLINKPRAAPGGYIPVNNIESTVTSMCPFEGWMDALCTTASERVHRWLLEHPVEARQIAFEAIAGLYLDDDGDILPEHDCYPRASGADYVAHVGSALERAKICPLIDELQEAWVDPDDEDEDE